MTAGSRARPQTTTITVRCLLFAGLREAAAGRTDVELRLPAGSRIGSLRQALAQQLGSAAALLAACRFAVDGEYVGDDRPLRDGQEVAVIPPVSGGQHSDDPVHVALVQEPIDPTACQQYVATTRAGAIVSFLGTVREITGERRTVYLSYEAYDTMAARKLREIAEEARERFSLERIAVVHRVGRMDPGEVSVAIAVSAAHRAQAFDGCRFVIEAIKKDVPIWKKEVWADGTEEWVHPGMA